jgi:hypothetical protein
MPISLELHVSLPRFIGDMNAGADSDSENFRCATASDLSQGTYLASPFQERTTQAERIRESAQEHLKI